MTKATMLPSANPDRGCWGTSVHNGFEAALAGDAASDALATAFDLTPAEIRDLLDSRYGRHLADDLSFIPGGPVSHEAIEAHLMARLADRRWRRWLETAIREVRAA